MAKLKVVHKWVGLGRVQSFMLICHGCGGVGLLHLWVGFGGVKKLDPRPTVCAFSRQSLKHAMMWQRLPHL